MDAIINEFAKQNYSMTYKNDDNVVNTENKGGECSQILHSPHNILKDN